MTWRTHACMLDKPRACGSGGQRFGEWQERELPLGESWPLEQEHAERPQG